MGNVLLIAAIIILLTVAVIFARRYAGKYAAKQNSALNAKGNTDTAVTASQSRLSVKQLVFCAAAIALGTVLSNIKLFHFPTGGSITLLSMLVICLPGYFFGLGAGLMTGVAYGILQLLIDPYVLFPMQLVVDYLLAFGALGLSGFFSNAKYGLVKGYLAGIIGRYIFAVISGWIFFGSYAWEGWGALTYSIVYNAIYIFAEAAVTILILCVPAVRSGMGRIKAMALM
ncbi:MAG: energy-coupled thiamine transporter ThiT [Eubacterium sp.]|nr:energy-coupled thiamine transporter ThiT [Eubacterium sp.]